MNYAKVIVVSVVRNFELYDKFVARNTNYQGACFKSFDNSEDNIPIPIRYNAFLDSHDYPAKSWLMFCHEDFELREDIVTLMNHFDPCALHGVVGSARRGIAGLGMQVIYGNMMESRRDGEGMEWSVGKRVSRAVEVESFDCCCLIVHSSLIEKYGLRFDENLLYDLYVEDFCAMAKVNYGIKSYVHPVYCCHHSGSRATNRLYRHLPYLAEKYKQNCFSGTLVYFGTPNLGKRLQDRLLAFWRKGSN